MRIGSGVIDQYIYFVAVDSTDFTTRETGLTTFTVYRSRNGGAAVAMSDPTINETDGTNMPGVYELFLDEDMTLDAADDTQEMCFHITQADMAPVTRTIELYRPKITVGNTLDVTSTGGAGIDWGNVENPTTAVDLSGTHIQLVDTTTTNTDMRGTDSAATAANLATVDTVVDAIKVETDKLTLGDAGVGVAGSIIEEVENNAAAITALNNVAATDIVSAGAITTLSGAVANVDLVDLCTTVTTTTTAANLTTNNDKTGYALSAAGVDAIWDETMAGHVTADSAGLVLNEWQDGGRLDLILDIIAADTTTDIPALIAALNDISTAQVNTEVDTALTDIGLDHLISVAAADVPADGSIISHLVSATEDWSTFVPSTDSLQAIRDRGDAEWATGSGGSAPTAAEVAGAVWDEDATGHQTGGSFGQAIGDPASNTETMYEAVVTDAAGTNLAADVIAVKATADAIEVDTTAIEVDTAELGAAVGASLSADIAAVKVDTAATLVDTGTAGVVVASIATNAVNAAALATDAIDEIRDSMLPTQNVAFNNLPFLLVDETDHVTRETGQSPTATGSIDGAAFGATTGTVTEVGNGIYQFDASAADMDGGIVTFRFVATGCDDAFVTVVTGGGV